MSQSGIQKLKLLYDEIFGHQSPGSPARVRPPTTARPVTMATTQFPWELVSQVGDYPMMERLESTCDMGCYYASKLAHLIGKANFADESFTSSVEKSFLRKCVTDSDSLIARGEQKQILVGVSGATGAGKSSLLNALLDCPGLLPASDSSASTATICEVAYSFEEDQEKAFRCDVFFRDLDDVRGELDTFFQDLRARNDLLAEDSDSEESDCQDDKDRQDAIKEATANLQRVRDKIFAIWGRTIGDLDGMSADDLLRQDEPALDYIRSEKQTVYSHDLSDFSAKIRRFLDSSHSEIQVARPEGCAQTMSLWPLIQRVKLFVKADILKSGLVLVDLPGLSDVVGARAHLAEKYYAKLDVTMIVTPVVRGADEITGVNLMSKNQALNMKMDGKYNDRSFCVVLSKADVLDWPRCDPPSLPMHKKLQDKGRQIKTETRAVKKSIDALRKRRHKAKNQAAKVNLSERIKEEKKNLRNLKTSKKQHARMSRSRLGTASFKYRQARDQPLFEKIRRILKQQHDDLKRRSREPVVDDFTPPQIFSVGTRAYWDIKEGVHPEGFPGLRYTGVPALRQWLKEVTIPSREKATKALLREYQSLYNNLQIWSDDLYFVRSLKFSAEEFEEQTLDPMLEELKGLLEASLKIFEKNIRECNPLKGHAEALKECSHELQQEVRKWAPRSRKDKIRFGQLSYMTFAAIVRRSGGPFTSRAGGVTTYYHWMEDLTSLFNGPMLGTWTKQLHQRIPELVLRFKQSTDVMWGEWHHRLVLAMLKNAPGLDSSYLSRQAAKLSVIKEQFKTSVSAAVSKFVAEGPQARTNLLAEVTVYWKPGFEAANGVPGGPGVTKRKEDKLLSFSKRHGEKVFENAVTGVQWRIQHALGKLQPRFDSSLSRLLDNLRLQSQLIARNVTDKVDKVRARAIEKEAAAGEYGGTPRGKLMADLRAVCVQWSGAWHSQDFQTLMEKPDESVPREWSVGREFSLIEESDPDSGSESESDDEMEEGDTKQEEREEEATVIRQKEREEEATVTKQEEMEEGAIHLEEDSDMDVEVKYEGDELFDEIWNSLELEETEMLHAGEGWDEDDDEFLFRY